MATLRLKRLVARLKINDRQPRMPDPATTSLEAPSAPKDSESAAFYQRYRIRHTVRRNDPRDTAHQLDINFAKKAMYLSTTVCSV